MKYKEVQIHSSYGLRFLRISKALTKLAVTVMVPVQRIAWASQDLSQLHSLTHVTLTSAIATSPR